jgi:hypothetical protein
MSRQGVALIDSIFSVSDPQHWHYVYHFTYGYSSSYTFLACASRARAHYTYRDQLKSKLMNNRAMLGKSTTGHASLTGSEPLLAR